MAVRSSARSWRSGSPPASRTRRRGLRSGGRAAKNDSWLEGSQARPAPHQEGSRARRSEDEAARSMVAPSCCGHSLGPAAVAEVDAAEAKDAFMPDFRARDLLPLPEGRVLEALLRGDGPPRVAHGPGRRDRAGGRRAQQDQWLSRGIRALNHLGGGGRPPPQQLGQVSAGQRRAVRELARHYGRCDKPPEGMTPAGAYTALRGTAVGYAPPGVAAG
eukprot:1816172-Lingulodinium_polyedra.AAC.1